MNQAVRHAARPGSLRPGVIAAAFLLLSAGYVLISERWLASLRSDAATHIAQSAQGWIYVIAAAGLVYLLERQLARRSRRALDAQRAAYEATIEAFARALYLRDHETEGHGRRVADLAVRLGERLGLAPSDLVALRHGALLHDVGKIGVSDAILHRSGPLDAETWGEMRRHPVQGQTLLADVRHLRSATTVVRSHHERWDGGGYPDGLIGEAIPRLARIFAVVDVYDALMSDRPYRSAWPEAEVLAHLRLEAGRHFDPQVVEAFLALVDEDRAGVADVAAVMPGPVSGGWAAPR